MRVVPIEEVPLGSPLGQALYNERGDVLAQAGVMLDSSLLASIRARGYSALFVEDKQSQGIAIADPLSPATRTRATKASAETIGAGDQLANRLGADFVQSVGRIPESKDVRQQIAESVPVDAVFGSASQIVEEVLDAPTELGLNSIKAQDSFAYGHAVEVASVAAMLGRKMGMKKPDLRRLTRGALLHDIGQVFTGDTVDGKTGALSPSDLDQMKKHTRMGFDFLQNVPDFDAVANHVAYQHHEWFNGQGYPRGLHGTPGPGKANGAGPGEILLIAQITSIADVYDALCSDRPFRARLPRELAVSLMKRMAGAQLNAGLLEAFFSLVPVYPTGYPVRVVGGSLDRWQGVVAKLGEDDINRPIVRLFVRPDGSEVEPFEVDLAQDSTARLMTSPPKRRAAPVS